ncbi:MAG TPA: hypothetical protein VM265_07365 [Sphingomicrobium sp.]|nr:hypothetical protein [Sphingomicrobium sp.]
MTLDVLAAVAAVLLADPAAGKEQAKAPEPARECRTEVQTGSRMGRKRICATREVWDQIREDNLEAIAHTKANAERSRPCTSVPCR